MRLVFACQISLAEKSAPFDLVVVRQHEILRSCCIFNTCTGARSGHWFHNFKGLFVYSIWQCGIKKRMGYVTCGTRIWFMIVRNMLLKFYHGNGFKHLECFVNCYAPFFFNLLGITLSCWNENKEIVKFHFHSLIFFCFFVKSIM